MKSYENTFVRGPSPSYSDEGASAMSSFQASQPQQEFFDGKSEYVGGIVKQGRNTFAFWTVVVVLLILTVGNLMLTLTIIGVLHLGKGIRGMELIPEEDILKFYGSSDLDRIYSKGIGQIDGFSDIPVSIEGNSVYLRLNRNGQIINRLIMDNDDGIQFRAINNFEIKDPNTGKMIFTTHRPHYNIPKGADTLLTRTISSSRVTSPLDKNLLIDGDGRINIKGSEGILIYGSNVLIQAEHSLGVNASRQDYVQLVLIQAEHSLGVNASQTMFEGGAGIYLDMDKIPIVSSEFGLRTGNVQYKMCVCMPQGRLFRIAIPRVHNGPKITCTHFSSAADPCANN